MDLVASVEATDAFISVELAVMDRVTARGVRNCEEAVRQNSSQEIFRHL